MYKELYKELEIILGGTIETNPINGSCIHTVSIIDLYCKDDLLCNAMLATGTK